MKTFLSRFATTSFALALAACTDGATMDPAIDAGPAIDADSPDSSELYPLDTGYSVDANRPALDAGPDQDADAPAPTTEVALDYRDHTGTLDRAFVGYHYASDSVVGLYFELSRGADGACPSETSPVPQQIITIDGVSAAPLVAPFTASEGVSIQFFDFEGVFRTEIAPDTATDVTVEVSELDLTAGTASADVVITFADGTARGTLHATHCDSLDVHPE